MAKAGFTPISFDAYVDLHMQSNPKDMPRDEVVSVLRSALNDHNNGTICHCGNPVRRPFWHTQPHCCDLQRFLRQFHRGANREDQYLRRASFSMESTLPNILFHFANSKTFNLFISAAVKPILLLLSSLV